MTRAENTRRRNPRRALLAIATLCLALLGCDAPARRTVDQFNCAGFCADDGMVAVGRINLANASGCICAVDRPIDAGCGLAWNRADTALELLTGCQGALNACATRGGK